MSSGADVDACCDMAATGASGTRPRSEPDPRGRPRVALYVQEFLTPSMTFIYRQLLGIESRFEPIVLAVRRSNETRFPFRDVLVARAMRGEDLLGTTIARLRGRSFALPPLVERRWVDALRARATSLIHAHFGPGGMELLPVAQRLRIPLVVTFHGYDASRLLGDRRYVRNLHVLLGRAHGITVSEEMRSRLVALGLPDDRLQTHYIGVPLERFGLVERMSAEEKAMRGEPRRLLQVSNFVEKKGHAWTLRAFAQLRARRSDVELVLAGDGPLRQECEELARALGVGHAVSFPGLVETREVLALMREADVFVHHSVTAADGDMEGIPTVLMEAMATGLPVVSTLHSGIPELVRDGETGLLVRERDVDGYVAALERALVAPQAMGAAAARFVRQHFDIDAQNGRLADFYARVIAEGSRL